MSLQESIQRVSSPKIAGTFAFDPEEFFRPGIVGAVCQEIWGDKADVKIAGMLGCTDRAVRDYFSGKSPLPSALLAAINSVLAYRRAD